MHRLLWRFDRKLKISQSNAVGELPRFFTTVEIWTSVKCQHQWLYFKDDTSFLKLPPSVYPHHQDILNGFKWSPILRVHVTVGSIKWTQKSLEEALHVDYKRVLVEKKPADLRSVYCTTCTPTSAQISMLCPQQGTSRWDYTRSWSVTPTCPLQPSDVIHPWIWNQMNVSFCSTSFTFVSQGSTTFTKKTKTTFNKLYQGRIKSDPCCSRSRLSLVIPITPRSWQVHTKDHL